MRRRLLPVAALFCLGLLMLRPLHGAPPSLETPAPGSPAPTPTPPPINPVVNNCNITPPNTAVTPALLTSGLPCVVAAVPPFDLDNLQHAFDFNSWLTFLSLNSPASGGTIGKDAPTIWQGWKEIEDIFLPGGQAPPPWEAPPIRPPVCPKTPNLPILRMVGKTPNVLSTTIQPFNTGPLIDQNGQYVHYEIVVNKPMFEYIVQNKLYSQQGQTAFPGPIEFPEGSVTQGTTGTIGAIVVKAAWKVLDPKHGDRPENFHKAQVLIYQPPQANPPIKEKCYAATVGLVGLHIVHRTQSDPQWVWASFEQVDNDPEQADVDAKKFLKHYNFFNPACASDPQKCPVNTQPPRPWNPDIVPFPGGFRSQIIRLTNLTPEANKINQSFQGILPGTVWQHYMMVSTQWPTDAQSKTDPLGNPAPAFLANTTAETYIQGTVPQTSSSCMSCHGGATDTQGHNANFTFVLERAKTQKTPPSGSSSSMQKSSTQK